MNIETAFQSEMNPRKIFRQLKEKVDKNHLLMEMANRIRLAIEMTQVALIFDEEKRQQQEVEQSAFSIWPFMIFMTENGIGDQIKMKNTYFWHPKSIVMVVLSASLFMIFREIKMKENSVISYIASCTFGIYLGHSDRSMMIWNAVFRKDLVGTKAVLTDMVCAFVCIVMTTLFIELIRKQTEKLVVKIYSFCWDLFK